MRDTLGLHN